MKRTALAIVVLLLLTSRESLAADPLEDFDDPTAAQSLVVEAHALIQKNRYAEACPKLEESLRLVPSVETRLDLANCNEQLGNVASAWTGFLDVAARSKAANLPDREKTARKRARALEARLPKLVIEVPNAPQGLEVKRDGIVVDAAAWGTAIPVDPGKHRVTVMAPGKQRWVTTVQSTEGTTTRVAVPRELAAPPDIPAPPVVAPAPPVAPEAPVAPAPPVAPEAPVVPATPDPVAIPDAATTVVGPPEASIPSPPSAARENFSPPALGERGATSRTLAWIVAGAGVVGLGVGARFGLASLASHDDSRGYCVGDSCNATGVSLRDDAIRDGNIATVSVVVGAAALVGGLVLMLTAPNRFETRRSASDRAHR